MSTEPLWTKTRFGLALEPTTRGSALLFCADLPTGSVPLRICLPHQVYAESTLQQIAPLNAKGIRVIGLDPSNDQYVSAEQIRRALEKHG